jgi:hypothetical protein
MNEPVRSVRGRAALVATALAGSLALVPITVRAAVAAPRATVATDRAVRLSGATPLRRIAAGVPAVAPVPRPADCAGGESAPPSLAEALHVGSEAVEGTAAAYKDGAAFANAGAEEAAESAFGVVLEGAAMVAGYAFIAAAFLEANDAFGEATKDPLDGRYTAVFTPVFAPVPVVRPPAARYTAAFAALNRLFGATTRFAELTVALRVSLDRAEMAAAAGDLLWLGRQESAAGGAALDASQVVAELPRLQRAVATSFVTDGLELQLSAARLYVLRSKLARRVPSQVRQDLGIAASALRPQTSPEVQALKALMLDTAPLALADGHLPLAAVSLPAALASPGLAAEDEAAAASLKRYAEAVLRPGLPARRAQLRAVAQGCGGGGSGGDGAASYGEPHEVTFAGDDYEFQAAGEFTLLESTGGGGGDLDIQIRQQPFAGTGDVAVDTATAMRVGSTILELAATASGNLELWVDRRPARFESQALSGGGELTVLGSNVADVLWPDGTVAEVSSGGTVAATPRRVSCNTGRDINVEVSLPPSYAGHLAGLLGEPGARFGADLTGGNGVRYRLAQLESPSASVRNYDVLYHEFGASWRVSDKDSLFVYPKGESTATFTDLAFPSKALTIQSLTPKTVASAVKACRLAGITNRVLLADCVFDVGLTGDSCYAGTDSTVRGAQVAPPATAVPSSGSPPGGATGSSGSGGHGSTTSSSAATSTTVKAPTTTVKPPTTTVAAGTTTTKPTTTTVAGGHHPASGATLTIGTSSRGSPSQPAVAVDGTGTGYAVWLQPDGTTLDFCKLVPGATGCHLVPLSAPDPSEDRFFDPPSVLVDGARIEVFESLATTHDEEHAGLDEYVSTDGGATFTLLPNAVGYVPGDTGTAGPVVELPGGNVGDGYVLAGANPAFQANSPTSPTDDSEAANPAYASLDPSPAGAYTIGNLGGTFASQLSGSPGVLGVFVAGVGKGSSPCPDSASSALVYAYASVSASTKPAQLALSPGSPGSPWRPLAKLDCDGGDPALGGGPSGLGLLETDSAGVSPVVQFRSFSPSTGFAAAVTVASGQQGAEDTLSEDGAGNLYATWLDGSTGVELATSPPGGAHWSGPTTLFSDHGDPSAIGALTSAVDSAGRGWAVYAADGSVHAQQFNKDGAVPASSRVGG